MVRSVLSFSLSSIYLPYTSIHPCQAWASEAAIRKANRIPWPRKRLSPEEEEREGLDEGEEEDEEDDDDDAIVL